MTSIFNGLLKPSAASNESSQGEDVFRPTLNSRQTLARLWRDLSCQRIRFIFLGLSGTLSSLALLVVPYLLGRAVDQLSAAGAVHWQTLRYYMFGAAICYVLGSIFQWVMQAGTQKLSGRLCENLRQKAFDRLLHIPLLDLDRQPRGDLISRLTADLDALADGLVQLLNQLFSGLLLFVGSLIMLLSISLWVSLVVFAITPLCFWVTSFIARRSYQYFTAQAQDLGQVNAYVEERLAEVEILQAFGAETTSTEAFSRRNERLNESGRKAQFFSSLSNPGTRFVNNIAYVLVALLSGLLAISGGLRVGQMTALLTYALQFAKPVNEISAVFTQLQNSLAGAARVYALHDASMEMERTQAELKLTEGQVSFRQVDFRYQTDQALIENLDLHVPADALVAIVGPTGAGKTTLVNLLMRFYELNAGRILVDGQNIADVSRSSLRRHIGMVLQDNWIFSATVRQNIAYGRPEASQEEVEAAAHQALADRFIQRLPQGYDTVLHENGASLSAGQKQLISIARVFLIAAELLILDEATSSIDTRSEQLIQKAFLKLMQGRTSFIIAHRLSTVRDAACILVMDKGQIVEQGTHRELLAKQGFYAELYNSQYSQLAANHVDAKRRAVEL